jgi:hypothetical protein
MLRVINWCCRLHRIKFGSDAGFKAGSKKMRNECADYLDRFPENEVAAPVPDKRLRQIARCKKILKG